MKNRFFDDDIIFKKNEFTEAILQNDEFLLEEYHEHKKEYDDFFERFRTAIFESDVNKDIVENHLESEILEIINFYVYIEIKKEANSFYIDFNILDVEILEEMAKRGIAKGENYEKELAILKKAKAEIERVVYMKTENIEMREKVIQSNSFIQNRTNDFLDKKQQIVHSVAAFDETQIKLINLMISHIKPDSTAFEWEEISFYEFFKFMGLKTGGKSYRIIFESIKKLMSMNFWMQIAPGEFKFFHFFESGSTVSINDNKIVLKFDDSLAPFFLNNKINFTRYELGFMAFLKGKYTCRIYEFLHSYLGLNSPLYISTEDFKSKICDTYSNITDIERYVINKAQSELENKADIRFTYKRKQKTENGRKKTVGWYFIIKEKTNKEKREVAGSWGLDWDDASFDYDAPKLAEIHSQQNEKKDMQKKEEIIKIDENDDLPFSFDEPEEKHFYI